MEPPVNNTAEPTQTESPLENKRSSLLNLLIIVVLVVLVGWSGLLFFQNRSLKAEEADLAATLERLESQAGEAESQASLATKKQFLATREESRVYWTNVLKRLFEANPQSNQENQRLVTYQALSGSKEGNISISIQTRAGAADPYTDTAILLREYGRRAFYQNLFIPNISSVFDQLGQEILTYTLNLNYNAAEDPVEQLIEKAELVNAVNDDDVDADTTLDEQVEEVANELRRRARAEETTDETENEDPLTENNEQ